MKARAANAPSRAPDLVIEARTYGPSCVALVGGLATIFVTDRLYLTGIGIIVFVASLIGLAVTRRVARSERKWKSDHETTDAMHWAEQDGSNEAKRLGEGPPRGFP